MAAPHVDKPKMALHREYMKKTREAAMRAGSFSLEYKTLYDVLGVAHDATYEEIRRAYKRLAMQHHPDKHRDATQRHRGIADGDWAVIPAAYRTLADAATRKEYDAEMPTRDALVAFYRAHNPTKLSHTIVETSIANWKGKEVELFAALNEKYEVQPHLGVAPTSPTAGTRGCGGQGGGQRRRAGHGSGGCGGVCALVLCVLTCGLCGGGGGALGGGAYHGMEELGGTVGFSEEEDEDDFEMTVQGEWGDSSRRNRAGASVEGDVVMPMIGSVARRSTSMEAAAACSELRVDDLMTQDDWATEVRDDEIEEEADFLQ